MSRLCQGDARYLISNSKDQSIKLWDVRKFSPKEGLAASRLAVTQQNWDYRWQQVPQRGEEGGEGEGGEKGKKRTRGGEVTCKNKKRRRLKMKQCYEEKKQREGQ